MAAEAAGASGTQTLHEDTDTPCTVQPSAAPGGTVPEDVLEKLAALETQRRNERDKRREAAQAAANPQENVQAFLQGFASRQQAAQQQLSSLQSGAGGPDASNAPAALDALAAEMLAQEQRLADASYYLPSFDLKLCSTQVQNFKTSLDAARTALLPKKKFAFSKKVSRVRGAEVQSASPEVAAVPSTLEAAGANERDMQLVAAGRGVAGLTDQVVVRHMDQPPGADFVVMDCSGCVLFLLGHLGALRLLHLRNCTVVAGPVTGATLMDNLQSCTLVLASYQIRIHRAISTDFYLRVRSRPIIEHSTGVRFAPYSLDHPPTTGLLQAHNLHEDNGLHSHVDDFGWIKAVQSPNWSVLPEKERKPAPAVPDSS